MDEQTLKDLLKEAEKLRKAAEKRFDKNDNVEDMHEMNWAAWTVAWLKRKLEKK